MEFKLRFLVLPDFIYSDNRLNATDIKVYSFINSYKGDKFYFTNEQLSEMFSVSDDSISRSMTRLAKFGYIEIDYKFKGDGGRARFVRNRKVADLETANLRTENPQHRRDKDNNIKDNKVKERLYTEVAEVILNYWNEKYQTKYKSIAGIKDNVGYWLPYHPLEDFKKAIDNIELSKFWKGKMTPMILFRRKNPRGEAVDYIEELINIKPEKNFEAEEGSSKYARFNS